MSPVPIFTKVSPIETTVTFVRAAQTVIMLDPATTPVVTPTKMEVDPVEIGLVTVVCSCCVVVNAVPIFTNVSPTETMGAYVKAVPTVILLPIVTPILSST